MRDATIKRLIRLAHENERLVLITGDLGFKVLDEFRAEFPNRFINAGVAEQNMAALAAGLAHEGRAVFTYSIANFPSLRCLEQIRNDICYHELNVKIFSIGSGFSYGPLGMSHHATEDIAIMRALPGMTVFSPGDAWEAEEATEQACRVAGPAYLRIDRSTAVAARVPGERFILGMPQVLKSGDGATIIACGGIIAEAVKASELLAADGISCRVISVPTLQPLDDGPMLEAANETGGIVTLEEHGLAGGLGGIVAERFMDAGVMPGFFLRLGLDNEFASIVGSQEYLRKRYGLDAETVASRVRGLVQARKAVRPGAEARRGGLR